MPLLLTVVLVPAVGVLWFMSQAMRNEQLAVRQKLRDAYQAQLLDLQRDLRLSWQVRSDALDARDPDLSPALVFARRVRGGLADSLVVLDEAGHAAYPASAGARDLDSGRPDGSWRRAERQEHSGQLAAAAAGYGAIARSSAEPGLAARALQAQARCLARAEKTGAALAILSDELGRARYSAARDSQGRLIAPSAQLRALQLIEDPESSAFQRIAESLAERLADYSDPALPGAQRRFLMRQLAALAPRLGAFDTLPAEELAQRYLESDPPAALKTSLQPGGAPGLWHLASPSGRVVALFDQEGLDRDFERLIAQRSLPKNATVELLPPGAEATSLFSVTLPAGGFLQDWRLVLRPKDQALFAAAAKQRINAYLITGALLVLAIILLAVWVARTVERQLRLTRLKNDLLATVSHELKTPLASTRLLVDTLLETGIDDSRRVLDYLHLIAKENARLSRLVDNFLTFSRMERNRQALDQRRVSARTVAEAAAATLSERLRSSDCRFELHIEPDLPCLFADQDALVTVLLNLLDNAHKYSDEDKHIILSVRREEEEICFAVRDNGIGMSGREAGKIFDRFYQIDQSLSRPGSGCGLGLSIVKLIVNAHGGSVEVASRPGRGSTFTVRLPVAPEEPSHGKEPS